MSLVDDYREWTGSLSDLEAECARLTAPDGPCAGLEAPNGRLVRHYCEVGVVDRPGRGPGARYDRRRLLQALAAKALLADGWTLSKIAGVTSALEDPDLERVATGRAAPDGLGSADAAARADALSAVRGLRGGARWIADPVSRMVYANTASKAEPSLSAQAAAPAPAASVPAPSSRARSAFAETVETEGTRALSYAPCGWLTGQVDVEALAGASEAEVDRAVRALGRSIKRDLRSLKGRS